MKTNDEKGAANSKTPAGSANGNGSGDDQKVSFPKATGLLFIVFCAVAGYIFTSTLISRRLIQYRSPIGSFLVGVYDEGSETKRSAFSLAVSSELKIDSVMTLRPNAPMGYNTEILFHENPTFMVWMILACIMVSISAGSCAFFIARIFELCKKFTLPVTKIFWSFMFAFSIIALLAYGNRNIPGFFQPPEIIDTFHILLTGGWIIEVIVVITMSLALPGLILLFLIGASSDRVNIRAKTGIDTMGVSNQDSIEIAVINLKYLNHLLQNTLQILSIIVVFAVLTTKTLGDSIKATISVKGFDLFPNQVSYVYGMYFTLFLCIVYIPVFAYLKNNYNTLNDLAVKEAGGATSNWYTNLFGQDKFEGTALGNIKLSLTVIAPLLTSFLPDLGELIK